MAKAAKKTDGAAGVSAAPAAPVAGAGETGSSPAAPVADVVETAPDPAAHSVLDEVASGERTFQVTAKRNGFRRCGLAWHGATTVQEAAFTAAQWKQLRNEPMLTVIEVEGNEGV